MLPDLGLTVAQLNQTGTPAAKAQFAQALSDLALLEGYFAMQPDAASKLVDSLKGVVADNAPEVARLQGWDDLIANRPDDAKAKFALAAAQDPLAELGMVKVLLSSSVPGDHDMGQKLGEQLIVDHPSGLIGAMIWEQLHQERVKLIPSVQAVSLQAPLAAYPQELLGAIDRPTTVYSLHVEPLMVGSFVGEPVLATISIANFTSEDLTIGPDGLLKPELLFKVLPQIGPKPVAFDAFDTIAGPSVLPSHGGFTQVVRLDQTQILSYLNTQPGIAFEINGSLSSNQVARGIGGYGVNFVKTFYRQATPLSPDNIQLASSNVTNGRADQKITALSLLQMFLIQTHALKTQPADAASQMSSMMEIIHHARLDPLPAVAAWASKCEAEVSPPSIRQTIVSDMAEDADWRHRQLAILMLDSLPAETRDNLLAKLVVDPQASVRADAIVAQAIAAMPTTAPATMPATAPAAPATAP